MPLHPSPLRRSRPMRQRSATRARREREWAALAEQARRERGNVCEVQLPGCLGIGSEAHHRAGRGKGCQTLELLLLCCRNCHSVIHACPAASMAAGLMLSRNEVRQ